MTNSNFVNLSFSFQNLLGHTVVILFPAYWANLNSSCISWWNWLNLIFFGILSNLLVSCFPFFQTCGRKSTGIHFRQNIKCEQIIRFFEKKKHLKKSSTWSVCRNALLKRKKTFMKFRLWVADYLSKTYWEPSMK